MAQLGSTTVQTLSAAGLGTVVGSTFSMDRDGGVTLAVIANITVAGGTTPTCDIKLQWSNDKTNWADAETPDVLAQITTVKAVAKVFAVKGAFVRSSVTIGGTTPAFTGTISVYPTR